MPRTRIITLEKHLPYFIASLLPGLAMLSNNEFNSDSHWYIITIKWLLISLFLFGLWKFIEYFIGLKNNWKRWLSIISGCILYILLFLFIEYVILPKTLQMNETMPAWTLGVKMFLGAFLFFVIIQSLKTARDHEKLRVEFYEMQSENLKAQLNQLQQQINPHFLFNCFSILRTMVRANDPQSEAFVLHLSDVYRQILQKRESAYNTLKDELAFLHSYIYLMKLRHENALFIDIQVSDESLEYHVPIFSLQLLVENCIKHNVVSENKPLYIKMYQTNKQNIIVSNNYQPKKTVNESFGLGIENLKTRYELIGIVDGVIITQTETEYATTLELF